MKLTEAIEVQEKLVRGAPSWSPRNKIDALKLGIEAMKARKREREDGYIGLNELLSGETKE